MQIKRFELLRLQGQQILSLPCLPIPPYLLDRRSNLCYRQGSLHMKYTISCQYLRDSTNTRLNWGSQIRTDEWRRQRPLPFRLAIPHRRCFPSFIASLSPQYTHFPISVSLNRFCLTGTDNLPAMKSVIAGNCKIDSVLHKLKKTFLIETSQERRTLQIM